MGVVAVVAAQHTAVAPLATAAGIRAQPRATAGISQGSRVPITKAAMAAAMAVAPLTAPRRDLMSPHPIHQPRRQGHRRTVAAVAVAVVVAITTVVGNLVAVTTVVEKVAAVAATTVDENYNDNCHASSGCTRWIAIIFETIRV